MLAQVALSREQTLQSMQKRFSREDPNASLSIMMVLASVAVVFGIVWLAYRIQQRSRRHHEHSPRWLYRRVLRQLDLPIVDRWRLWRLARVVELEHPSTMLISPKVYDAACKRYCGTSGILGSRAGAVGVLAALGRRLFVSSDK